MSTTTTTLYAQPYNLDASGFYFSSYEEYQIKSELCKCASGLPVEEYEVQYISGDSAELFEACSINQANLELWFDEIEELDESEQAELFYRCGLLGDAPEEALQRFGYDGYLSQTTLLDFVHQLIEDCGTLDSMPEELQIYFDVASYANDIEMSGDITQFEYDGSSFIAHGF